MNPRASCIPLLLLAACLPAHASQLVPLDLAELEPRSGLIVVGVVTAIPASDAESDTVSVQLVSALKGRPGATSFSLRLGNKGVKDFDPRLSVGDRGVFFLKGIAGGRAELAYPGSVAVIPKGGNFASPGRPDDAPDPFREYKGKEPVPEGLREAYAGFARSARGGSVGGYLLPGAVEVTLKPRPAGRRSEGSDVNEDFLMNGFSPLVRGVRRDGDECYLIRTDSTAIHFVQNKAGAWKVYRYADKPID